MRISTDIPFQIIDPAMIAQLARAADDSALHCLWVPDHLFANRRFAPMEDPQLEAYALLAFVAAHTRRIRLGTMVTAAVYRPPGLLGKIVTSLDVLSGGRTCLGLGAAWYAEEAAGLGIDFPPLAERFERLEEVVQILLAMWAGDERPFAGSHYQLSRPLNSPPCVQRPHPPQLIAGGGERRTLALVARYADACNLIAMAPPDFRMLDRTLVRHKLDVLRAHCARLDRPYDDIEKTVWVMMDVTARVGRVADQAKQDLESLAAEGVDHVMVSPAAGDPLNNIQALAGIAEFARSLESRDRLRPLAD